jgi:tRNA(Ile)-lysidine synthase
MTTLAAYRRRGLFSRVFLEVRREGLIPAHTGLLVALSGGPDSVALLAVLRDLAESGRVPGLRLHAAHVNYGLRGAESDEDEAFVAELGRQFGVPVHVERAELGHLRGASLQAQARKWRYNFFDQVCRAHGLSAIATGHTADDHAETILMWLIRGCGSKGLAGIPRMREGRIIRPLLHINRQEILDYLSSCRLTYRSDSSNAKKTYQRNRIRHDLLPIVRAFNPRVIQALARTAEILTQDEALLEKMEQTQWSAMVIESGPGRLVLDCAALATSPLGLQRRLVRRAWQAIRGTAAGLTFRHVTSVLHLVVRTGDGSLDLPDGLCAVRRGDHLIVESDRRGIRYAGPHWVDGMRLAIPGSVALDQGCRLCAEVLSRDEAEECLSDDRSSFTLDADEVQDALIVRRRRPGDWFCPIGMGGRRKKLQDFFVDQKVARHRRDQVPLVLAPGGIVWVGGYRGDERFRPQSRTSRRVRLSLVEEV